MWLFTPNAFVSAVAHRERPDCLMVRARFKEDLSRLFPRHVVRHTPEADYPFRCIVTRKQMAKALVKHVEAMAYDNVKDAIGDGEDHRYLAMNRVWAVMNQAGADRLRPRAWPESEDGFAPQRNLFLED